MNDSKDKQIAIRIDSAMSSCFEMISRLMYMKTIGSDTEDGRNRLMDELDEIVDIDKAIVFDLKGLNVLI